MFEIQVVKYIYIINVEFLIITQYKYNNVATLMHL